MKKHLILAAVAALATFNACSNDDEIVSTDCTPVNFTIQNVVTRATTSTDNKTTFQDNDEIGITSKGLYQDFTDQKFTVSVNGTTLTPPSDLTPQFIGTKQGTFYAYYPTSTLNSGVAADESKVAITVASDQSAVGAYQKNDLMISTATGSTSNPTVSFTFAHKLCLVKVDPSGLNVNVASVTINKVQPTATWTFGGDVATSGEATDIKMGKYSDGSNEYWAIIPAQEIAAGQLISVVTTDNKIYSYTTTSNSTFTANNVYKYKLGFNLKGLTANLTLETAWNEEHQENSAIVTQDLRELISQEKGSISSTTTISSLGSWSAATEAGWGKANTNATVEKTDDNYAKLTITAVDGSGNYKWYNNCIIYQTDKNLGDIRGTYKLIIEGKKETSTTGNLTLYVLAPAWKEKSFESNSQSKTFQNPYFATSAPNSTGTTNQNGTSIPLTTSDTTVEIEVNLNLVYASSVSGYNENADAETFSSGLVIALGGSTHNDVFYIKSITLKEME